MDPDDSKKETNSPTSSTSPLESKEDENKLSLKEDLDGSVVNTGSENVEVESRRSSISVDDEEEGKRNKRRKTQEDYLRKNSSGNGASPKSVSTPEITENEDVFKCAGSPGPKVPPLKIVIPPAECEQSNRNGKNATRHHGGLPYVVVSNDETGTASSTVTTSPSSPCNQCVVVKEEALSPSANTSLSNEEQRIQQRVLRSTHSSRIAPNNNSSNGCSSGSSSNVTSGNSSPIASETAPSAETKDSKEDGNVFKAKADTNLKGKVDVNSGKNKVENASKLRNDTEEEGKTNILDTRATPDLHSKDPLPAVELHPRKRKLKSKPEMNHAETDHSAAFGSIPHPHEVPVTNCYQMFMDIRRQIDVKRKGLFPIQPKPPQGFKDYLMNRCTYTLAGNSIPRLKRRNAEPPEGIPEGIRDLYQEQEAERYSLRMQHVVEKEKLVLSVEQEILRVHGRAARALANQALPFSACTILKDEEVYNVITPEQEEKDRNARSRYNGRLFISWLQDVDDKWEKIKEEMLARHHKEAESLNAIQKFNWDLKMRHLGCWKQKLMMPVDENHVPMISVSDDFDLLPE